LFKIGILEIWLPDDLELYELPAKFYIHPFKNSAVAARTHRSIDRKINRNGFNMYNLCFKMSRTKGRKKEGKRPLGNPRPIQKSEENAQKSR
jgi:hypothetical protein